MSMKLKRKKTIDTPRYPSFDDYTNNRDKYLRGLSLKGAALLAAGAAVFGSGCDNSTANEKNTAGTPKGPEVTEEIRLRGEMPAVAKPVPAPAPETMVDGGMVAPDPCPKPIIQEKIKAPEAPVKPDTVTPPTETPQIRGRVPAPTPPVKTDGKPVSPTPPKEVKILPQPPEAEIAGGMPVPLPPEKPVPAEETPAPPEKEKAMPPPPPRMRGIMPPPKPLPLPEEEKKEDGK